ncbi:hypothetical protein GCM10009543_34080 [Leifsonia naganoensis]
MAAGAASGAAIAGRAVRPVPEATSATADATAASRPANARLLGCAEGASDVRGMDELLVLVKV